MGIQFFSSAMPCDWNRFSTFNCAPHARDYTSTRSNDDAKKMMIETITQLLSDCYFTQTNINELILHEMQLVADKNDFANSFDLYLDPPVFLNTAEEIRAKNGNILFDKIKAIVDDQEMNKDEYFASLRRTDC